MKTSALAQKNGVVEDVRLTPGKNFPDGSALELVSPTGFGSAELLLWTKQKTMSAREIEHRGNIYRPLPLAPSFQQALLFPRSAKGIRSIKQIFDEITKVLKKFPALPEPQAALVAFWAISTWFADLQFSPVTLCISGPDVARAMLLLQILRYICRRGLILAGLTPAKLLALPVTFRPTLLLQQPSSSALKLLLGSNFSGVFVAGSGGDIQDLRCAKAIFTGIRTLPALWNGQTIQLPLSPLDEVTTQPAERILENIGNYFQPRLLQYRLDHWREVRRSRFSVTGLRSPTRELANALGACVPDDDDLVGQLAPLLAAQDQDALPFCNLDMAMMEILWPRLHPQSNDAPTAEMKMEAEFTAQINTFLLAAGQQERVSSEVVGSRVQELGLEQKRKKGGSKLLLTPETSRRIHQLARKLDPVKHVPGCPDCEKAGGDRQLADIRV